MSFSFLCPSLWNNLLLSVRSAISLATFKETSEDTCFWLVLSPMDTAMPDGVMTLRNCFLDSAVEHWFGCRATEPGFAGDIGAIETWLIDWLIIWVRNEKLISYISLYYIIIWVKNKILRQFITRQKWTRCPLMYFYIYSCKCGIFIMGQ